MNLTAKWNGIDDLGKKLSDLDKKVRRRILRNAIAKAAAILEEAAKQEAPVDTGALKVSIGSKVKTRSRKGNTAASAFIGPRSGWKVRSAPRARAKSQLKPPPRYAHLAENGRRGAGACRRFWRALYGRRAATGSLGRHFLARAFAKAEPRARELLSIEIRQAIREAAQ